MNLDPLFANDPVVLALSWGAVLLALCCVGCLVMIVKEWFR